MVSVQSAFTVQPPDEFKHVRESRKLVIAGMVNVGWNVFEQVSEGFIVVPAQVQCPAFQLCPSSCADRSVAQAKLLQQSA